MSPLVAYHATRPACRDSILVHGLVGNSPKRYTPCGVYVYREDMGIAHPTTFGRSFGARPIEWSSGPLQDVWQVEYIGPIVHDGFVGNALVLLMDVPPEHVTLVIGNK